MSDPHADSLQELIDKKRSELRNLRAALYEERSRIRGQIKSEPLKYVLLPSVASLLLGILIGAVLW